MPALKKIGAAALAAFGWTSGGGVTTVSASYLQVAGGGGGGFNLGGAGGAGGYLTNSITLTTTSTYTITVGAGGVGGANSGIQGTNGSSSSITGLTASVGGGGGGSNNGTTTQANGVLGGSGGGGAYLSSTAGTGGSGTSGQGNAGGNGYNGGPLQGGGGGGGASAVGANGTNGVGGNGGAGTASSISGSSVTYAGGGGGATNNSTNGGGCAGGAGGGGNGGFNNNVTPATNGTANLGGGGGGGSNNSGSGGNGGSGIVIISYAGAQQFGGGVVTSVGGNTIHTFNTSGTLSPLASLSASYLIVAGGAGGGSVSTGSGRGMGGGGAGGLLSGSGVIIDTNSTYLVAIGAGGAGATGSGPVGGNGSNSSFGAVSTTAVGGGGGSSGSSGANSGGSGGGGYSQSTPGENGAAGTSGQGTSGGTGLSSGGDGGGGGGGGATSAGGNGVISPSSAGNGGNGTASSISGTSVTYAGGGGGGSGATTGGGTGGTGGGGTGGNTTSKNGTSGTANLGAGGGGASALSSISGIGGSGGSGIVIISYAGATQQMAGGSVTITGGNVIHTFTSSGYLTPLTYYSNSLRFRSSASGVLTRTPTVTSNRQTWTFSCWVKRGTLTTFSSMGGTTASSSVFNAIRFTDTGAISCFEYDLGSSTNLYRAETSAVYRDPAAWYHVVFAFDSTQATSSNRWKLYVNGSQVTAFGTAIYPSQNYNTLQNYAGVQQETGRGYSNSMDGYLSNVYWIDGQAITPNSFGTFNSYGVWQPINYGGSYGTNGSYLPFNSGSQTYAGGFNGTSQYLSFTGNSSLQLSTGDFTMEAWIQGPTQLSFAGIVGSATPGTGWTWRINSSNNMVLANGVTSYTSSAAIPINAWTHVAVSRNGTSLRFFINGVLSNTSTSSDSMDLTSGGVYIARGFTVDTTNSYFTGSMSNLRVVKGTSLYNGNFVPSTAPLTAVSGTSLLTLQNATLIDNSTNAFTFTNNGSVATSTNTIVFNNSYSLSLDKSPQGNNWTPANISNTTGSTYDSMTDVPTLTSATAANYCVMNPLKVFTGGTDNLTLSNGNLTATDSSTSVRTSTATMSFPSTGKFYFECYMASVGATQSNMVGVIDSSQYNGNGPFEFYGAYRSNGAIYNLAQTAQTSGATYTTGDWIGIAVDITNGTVQFYKNNVAQGATPSFTFTAGTQLWAYVATDNTTGTKTYNLNFGQQPFTYSAPSGFVALNTYNL